MGRSSDTVQICLQYIPQKTERYASYLVVKLNDVRNTKGKKKEDEIINKATDMRNIEGP